MRIHTREIRRRFLELVFWGQPAPAAVVAEEYGLTHQGAHLHLSALERAGLVHGHGQRRSRRYSLPEIEHAGQTYRLDGSLSAQQIWDRLLRGPTFGCGPQAYELLHHAGLAVIANAIEHSGGDSLRVDLSRTAAAIGITFADNGVGVFNRIAEISGANGPYEAAVRLADQPLTNLPGERKGEGLYYASRCFDRFSLSSGRVRLARTVLDQRMRVETSREDVAGTRVVVELLLPPHRSLKEVFRKFAPRR